MWKIFGGMIWRRLQSMRTLLMMGGCSRPWHIWEKAKFVSVQVDLRWQILEGMTGPCSGLGHRDVWWDGACRLMVMCLVKHAQPAYEASLLQVPPAKRRHHTWHTGVPAVVAADKSSSFALHLLQHVNMVRLVGVPYRTCIFQDWPDHGVVGLVLGLTRTAR